ncbi:uncharacterized protein LOC126660944 isoform X1 [Mercurialis annua]|uniref:uncharacterized protein LOC126660944 isoform X1 n=1 Tax=Mercurialis annua TaxID=3986 RepID=UPI00215FDC5B|nr:uncharacterized protein LOC126660944 isoform X1 [Mercurialis annua]
MALNINSASPCQISSSSNNYHFLKLKNTPKYHMFNHTYTKIFAKSEESESFSGSLSSTRTQLDLLDQLTSNTSSSGDTIGYESDDNSSKRTIRQQLAKLVGERDEDEEEFSIPLGKNLKKFSPKFLTISQKRNIKRQAYLNEVSQRNDSVFFATIGAFVILPPILILAIAILTGYVQLFP